MVIVILWISAHGFNGCFFCFVQLFHFPQVCYNLCFLALFDGVAKGLPADEGVQLLRLKDLLFVAVNFYGDESAGGANDPGFHCFHTFSPNNLFIRHNFRAPFRVLYSVSRDPLRGFGL